MLASFARWIAVVALILPLSAAAHEVLPSIADMEAQDGVLTFDVRANLPDRSVSRALAPHGPPHLCAG